MNIPRAVFAGDDREHIALLQRFGNARDRDADFAFGTRNHIRLPRGRSIRHTKFLKPTFAAVAQFVRPASREFTLPDYQTSDGYPGR